MGAGAVLFEKSLQILDETVMTDQLVRVDEGIRGEGCLIVSESFDCGEKQLPIDNSGRYIMRSGGPAQSK
jgi:hypothetical protein